MGYLARESLKFVVGLVIVGSWLFVSAILAVTAQLMRVDEAWQGWGDVLLNPFIVLSYLAFSATMAAALWFLFRRRR